MAFWITRTNQPRIRRLLGPLSIAASVALLGAACSDEGSTEAAAVTADPPLSGQELLLAVSELDTIVEDTMERTGVPGVAVAVVNGDEVLYTRGYGVRSTETGERVDSETVFQIASMSKPISSTIMSGLVGEGAFKWDDPISEHTDDFALSDPWVSENVTFADLFAHRSGLPGGPAGNDLEAIGMQREDILGRLEEVPLDPFRDHFSYSNWGMTLGGEAAAQASGETWEEAADRVLFRPAGMDSTSMRHEDYLSHDNRSELHVETSRGWVPDFPRQPDPQAPAGGVSSNVVDLAKWVRLQLAGGSIDGEQIIDTESLDLTHTPHVTKTPADGARRASTYGLGWNVATNGADRLEWNHSGAFSSGAATAVKIIPEEDLGIVVLTNGEPIGVPEQIADEWLEYVLTGEVTTDWAGLWSERMSHLYGEPLDLPDRDGGPAADPSTYAGTYSNSYAADVVVAPLDGGLALLMGPDQMVFPLEHRNGDTFTYLDSPELPDLPALAEFEVPTGSDEAVTVTLSSLDGAGLGTLERT